MTRSNNGQAEARWAGHRDAPQDLADPPLQRSPITRRRVLATGGLASLGAVLAACGGSSSPASGSSATSSSASPSSSASATASSAGSSSASASSAASTTSAGQAAVTLDDATKAILDAAFDEGVAATGVAGVAASVWIGDQVWTRSAGVRDLETKQAFVPDEHVRIASITKSYTATAVLQLVDQGALTLEDTLEQYVPGIANGDKITVADMLGMRSGVFDYTSDPTFGKDFDADPTLPWSDEQTLAIIKANPPAFAPGEKVVYADSNYALLGMIMQQVTGKPPGQVITENVIAKLDLPGTSYPTGVSIPDPHPTGYVPDVADPSEPFDNAAKPPRVVNDLNPAVAGTAGAMISRMADLRVWAGELTDGSLLKPETQEARLSAIKKLDGQQINFGYGLGIIGLNEFLGHDGAIYGFSSAAFRRPQTDTTIVIVANESSNFTTPTLTIAFGMIAKLYPDQVT